jgi:hypothetical protein
MDSIMTATETVISTTYFGMTIESLNYNFSYLGGPVETTLFMPVSIARSWDVWSPGNGQIEYLDWQDLNPAAGVYNWSALDAWIATNESNNVQMDYTFGSPPAWAGGITTNLADFQAFVTAIVTHANGAIKYWEGFNEFDVSGISPTLLVQLQEIIYNTVHALDPGALVLSPTVCGAGDDPLFAQFLADGGGKYFDIAAFHGYNNSTGEGIIPVVQDFQAVLSQYALSNVPIWDTEWGMESPTIISDTTAQQAYVSTGLILQAALGVQTEMFYAYDSANSELYDRATGQLTPAGVAYQQTEEWLTGATLPSGYQLNGSVYTVQLVKDGQNDLLVWNSAGQSSFSAGSFTEYVNAQGQVEPIVGGAVTIGTVPILLEDSELQAPTIVSASPASTAGEWTLQGTAAADSTVIVSDAAGQLGTTTVNTNGSWSFTIGTLASGAYSFTAVDSEGGNNSAASSPLTVVVDPPVVLSVVASGTGITDGSGDLNVGHVVTLTLTMSEAVTINTTGGTPTLTLNDGGTATYAGGSGSNALTFSYTVVVGQNTSDLIVSAISLNGATIADTAGNNASLSGTFNPTATLQIDTTSPAVSSVTASGSGISNGSGDLNAGHVVTLTLIMSEAVTVKTAGGTPTLTLNDGGTAVYTGGSGSNALTFSYTVVVGQNTADLIVSAISLNGATIADTAGNNASLSGTFNPTATLQIDTTSPAASSVTVSGSGISDGSGDLNAGHVVTLTLTMSEAVIVANGTPTLTLSDGGTAAYTGGSGSNALTFSYTVATGQNTPGLTVSAVNLNGATIADAGGNNASLSGTFNPTGTLQIDTMVPSPPVMSTDAINANNSITLTGTAEANTTLTVYDGATVAGTTTASTNGMWSYTTGPLGSGAQVFTATATDAAGNTSAPSSSIDPTIGAATTPEIVAIYGAVLQCAPTNNELTASLAIGAILGSTGMVEAIADSAEAITGVYPVLQMFNLAFGHFPSAATLTSMVDTGLTLPQLAAAIVGSQTFANTYDAGTLIDPNSSVTAGIVEALYNQALGHAPSQATLNGWLNSGLTVAQAFLDMVTSQSYVEATQPAVEQYLTTAAINNASYPLNSTAADLTPTQIGAIYEAVLQRAPTATEVSASLALDSATGDIGVIVSLVDSAAAIGNVYPILQMFELAFGYFPAAATLASMVETALTVPQLAAAIVASQAFANTYNGGVLIDPSAPVTAAFVEALYNEAVGHAPTPATLEGWLTSGLTIAQAFEDMVTSQSYFQTTQMGIECYLTAAVINEAGLTTINGTQATGALTLGTATTPLTQAGLTVLGGSGALTVVASGAGDTINELTISAAGGTITANGASDIITGANGATTITANGVGDTITLGAVSTGISITSPQNIHASGTGDVITFATTAADGTAVTWEGTSAVDGGTSSTGIGPEDTINFGTNTGDGSEAVVVTGDLTGTTTAGGTSTSGIAMTTLANVVDGHGDQVIFDNASTEVRAGNSVVNVSSANSLAQALDIAASVAAASQSGGTIGAHTGVIDWFQYGGNTYLVEAVNFAANAAAHAALAATDEIIKIVGLVSLEGASLQGHTLTL